MINPISEESVYSMKDVLNTLALFMDNGGYSNDELLCFVSYLTGLSEDALLEAIRNNGLPCMEDADPIPKNANGLTRERVMDILSSYVSNDAEAAELDYVQTALEQAGCDRKDAEALGLGWVFPEEE